MIPLMVSKKRAKEIRASQYPRRTFLFIEDGLWVGIDIRNGNFQEKKFSTIKGCMKWLKQTGAPK